MKKSAASLLGLVLLAACAIAAVALSPQGPQASAPVGAPRGTAQLPSPAPDGDIQVPAEELLDLWADRADFGGLYYDEEGVLVVNVAGDISGLEPRQGMRYQEVTYPLRKLEAVKDFLADYMYEYAILVLDANEVTNQVDVCLQVYTQEAMDQLQALVTERYPDMDCLQFEDWSGRTISFT